MKNRKFLFVAKLVVLSVIIFYLWEKVLAEAYMEIVSPVVQSVVLFLDPRAADLLLWNEFSYNLPTFLTLGIALKLSFFLQLLKLELGVAGIFIWHVLILAALNLILNRLAFGNIQAMFLPYIFLSVLNMAMPFLVWVILFKKEIQSLLT